MKILRTYNTEYQKSNLKELQDLMNEGYKVKFVTPMKDYIEYILEI
jgi:hypothetical protein